MLDTIFHHLQRQLFPALAAELGPLSALDQQFCEVISLTDLGRFTRRYQWCGNAPRPLRAPGWRTPSSPSTSINFPPPPARSSTRSNPAGPGPGPTLQGTQRGRAGEQFVERALWPTLGAGARASQGDVPFDVRAGGADGHGAVCAAVLNDAKPAAGPGRPSNKRPNRELRAEPVCPGRKTEAQRLKA